MSDPTVTVGALGVHQRTTAYTLPSVHDAGAVVGHGCRLDRQPHLAELGGEDESLRLLGRQCQRHHVLCAGHLFDLSGPSFFVVAIVGTDWGADRLHVGDEDLLELELC